jgi:hypothetical protein
MHSPGHPADAIRDGARILGRVLLPHGFEFHMAAVQPGSGGTSCSGMFRRADRTIEFHYRHGLGLVEYRVGQYKLGHSDFVRAVGSTSARYPGFFATASEAFEALASDIESILLSYILAEERAISSVLCELAPPARGFSALSAARPKDA